MHTNDHPDKDTPGVSRRTFVQCATAGIGAAAWAGSGANIALGQPNPAPSKDARRVARIAHLTDVHVQPEHAAGEGFAACLKHVHTLQDPPELILFGGDSVMEVASDTTLERAEEQLAVWRAVLKEHCTLPYRMCIGNHDVLNMKPIEGKQWAMDSFGLKTRYYSFDQFGWHFIVLDSTDPKDDGHYRAKLDDEQFAWLENDLANTPADIPVLVLTHIPILAVCAYFDGDNEETGNWVVPGAWMHIDSRRIKNLFLKHPNVKLCISGHEHLVDEVSYNGVAHRCNGAVCGAWWDGPCQEFEPGYGIIDLYEDGSFHNQYVTYGWIAKD